MQVNLSNFLELLDSKDITYIHKVLFLIENLMASCPENFVESFIREGVIDNIKLINDYEESAFFSSEDIEKSNNYYTHMKYNKNYNQIHYEKDFYNNQFLYKDYRINRENPIIDEIFREDKENNYSLNLNDNKKIITLAGNSLVNKVPMMLEHSSNIEKLGVSKDKKEYKILILEL